MAIGAYATLAAAKLRLIEAGVTDTSNDTLITELCGDVNSWIESRCQRVLAPIPAFGTTLNGGVSAGATSLTLTSVTGLHVGDDILVGLLTGTHESTNVLNIAGSVATVVPLANAYSTLAPVQVIVVQDGFSALDYGMSLIYDPGLITLAAVETAPYTGGPFSQIVAGDWFLRPTPTDPGWPFFEVLLTNVPHATTTYPVFYPGFANIRLIGPGPCTGQTLANFTGWPAIEDAIGNIALKCVVTEFRARASGGRDTMTINVGGDRTYEAMLSYTDRMTLERHRVKVARAV
jgi:hypothetical protein